MPLVATALAVAGVAGLIAFAIGAEHRQLDQYRQDCSVVGGEVKQVGPDILLCLDGDGRVLVPTEGIQK